MMTKVKTPPCAHCGLRPLDSYTGLCGPCIRQPELRKRYSAGFENQGTGTKLPDGPVPSWSPTLHMPGTHEKMLVMAQRAKWLQPIFHPLDAALPHWMQPPRGHRPKGDKIKRLPALVGGKRVMVGESDDW